jgi:hypothetical protein
MRKPTLIAAELLFLPLVAIAQSVSSPSHAEGYFFVGPIVVSPASVVVSQGGISTGFGGDVLVYKGLGFGAEAEYAKSGNSDVGEGSFDACYHFLGKTDRRKIEPFASGGYSVYFGQRSTENGFNIGGGVNYWMVKHVAFASRCERTPVLGTKSFME